MRRALQIIAAWIVISTTRNVLNNNSNYTKCPKGSYIPTGCICLIVGVIYLYRIELGVVDMLSTPYGQEYEPNRAQ